MKSITDLPSEDLYPLIFRNLSIEDLFNCRLVNNQFKYFSDTDGINKLIIGQPNLCNSVFHWIFNNKPTENEDIISLECFRTIKSKSIFNLDKNLKYLKIYDEQFKLEELSNLTNLESLELGYEFDNHYQQIINLNNLKVFVSNYQSVKLNTSKLEKIQFGHINRIKLDFNTASIKHLITRYYDNKLEIFNNLEIIELRNITDQSVNENLLIIFKNLKQLKINLNGRMKYSNEGINNSLIKILNDKMKLRREIDIYLEGVKIENIDKFNELKENENSKWQFRLNNYDLLDLNLSFIQNLNYDQLEECVNNIENDLPSTFFDKFQNIHQVDVASVNDVDGLNWFLHNLKYLIKFSIDSRVSSNEIFYNNLPNTIRDLYIDNQRKDINYDFILKLSKLIEFFTPTDKDLFDLVFTSFLNLKYLKRFEFYFEGRNVLILKNGKYFYLNDYHRNKKLDYNQLIVECNQIRSK